MATHDATEKNRAMMEAILKKSYENLHDLDVNSEHAEEVNRQLLARLLRDNENTEFGRAHGFAGIHDADAYRAQVPLSTYEDYEEAVERMVEGGEKNIITAYPIVYYASTSGTSGQPKKIPISDHGFKVVHKYGGGVMPAVISEFFRNTKLRDCPMGYQLMAMSFSKTPLKDGTMFGSLSAMAVRDKATMDATVCTPAAVMMCTKGADLKYLHARYGLANRDVVYLESVFIPALLDLMHYIKDNWRMLVEDIRKGTLNEDAMMPDDLRAALQADLVPDPERADELERAFSQGFDRGVMSRIWPKFSAVCAIWAGNFSSYARKLQEYSGRSIPYFTMVYGSSEGAFGVARHPHDQYYILVPDSCFFEFIPMDGKKDESEENDPRTVLLGELEEGKEYELVITNQSGFYRYRMGDVIRVIGFYNESPMVIFKYRLKNIVSVAGEKFTEDHLLSAVKEFERRTSINVIDFCMYPDYDAEPARYVILIEPDEVVSDERKAECAAIMGEELAHASTSYAHYVAGGNMGEPRIIFLQQETFQFFREMKMYKMGLTENQLKTVRVLNTSDLIHFFTLLEER